MAQQHISSIATKTVEVLANADMFDDAYHQKIKDHARVLYQHGYIGATYQTSWTNKTLWQTVAGKTVTVDAAGNIGK